MSYWTTQELKIFRELNWLDHKKLKIRKDQYCYNSGYRISKGKEVEAVKVFPNNWIYDWLDKPKTFYRCGTCGECTH